ncbi:MAG: hypothetical protein ABWY82_13880 [Tardiphaga sp.]|jgi:hypothetical protein
MFIRWQKYRSTALWHRGEPPIKRVKAGLIEAVRIDGKPRQRHIALISSYEPEGLSDRFRFWREARQRLDRLGNRITPEDRIKIETTLAQRVPLPTPEEIAAHDAEEAESWEQLKALAASRR